MTTVIDFDAHPVIAHVPFESYGDWSLFAARNPKVFNRAEIDAIGNRIAASGIIHPLKDTKHVSPDLKMGGVGYRGGIISDNVVSRHRAIMVLMKALCADAKSFDRFRIYALEAITPLALHLSKIYTNFVGSEFAPSLAAKERIHPAIHQDLMNLDFRDGIFDLIVTSEILEHVPSINKALAEMHRVLRPGGWHIGTHPFLIKSESSIVKAVLEGGRVVHLTEPEYHGNPVNPGGGSLVFELPGWDILERARAAGFGKAQMWFVLDERAGVLADTCGVYVLCLQKAVM